MTTKTTHTPKPTPIPETTEDEPITTKTRRILRVEVYTPIAKTLNGHIPSSTMSNMLRLTPTPYTYTVKDKQKTSTVETYLIKGLRGLLRHSLMEICQQHGIEACHTSEKTHTQKGDPLIPPGFHPTGTCDPPCIIHQLFGSLTSPSKIKTWADPIANFQHKTHKTEDPVQHLHIAIDRRMALSYDGKAIQHFQDRYFSGTFTIQTDVTKLTPVQLGALVDTILNLQQLGADKASGYGHLTLKRLQLTHETTTKTTTKTKNGWKQFKYHTTVKPINAKIDHAQEAWKSYLEQSAKP